ncbi:hypothetical protein [Nocardioides salarius]|uniref:hypothetical protein n=1 Tax=Nocardioides salarius TaxID=374513 RepID=UPI0030FAEEEE
MTTSRPLTSGSYSLRFEDLYSRVWDLGTEQADGTRVYVSAGDAALKWLIQELTGTPAESGRTRTDNHALRKQFIATMVDDGWADRVGERRYVLLTPPPSGGASEDPDGDKPVPLEDPDDHGTPVDEVPTAVVAGPAGDLVLADATWSAWTTLAEAVRIATTSPGVYVAKVADQIVYVGMAGERRGQGVRGRLTIYARGRGAVSGLGEAVLDRALADADWVVAQLEDLRRNGPTRAKAWAARAFDRQALDIAWTATATAKDALDLERQALLELADADLWNRARPRS